MKVVLQRTVDLNEVPFKIEEAYKECLDQLEIFSHAAQSINVFTPDVFISRINSLRAKMVDIDSKFEECGTLMSGYKQAIEQMNAETPDNPLPQAPVDVPPIPEEFLENE